METSATSVRGCEEWQLEKTSEASMLRDMIGSGAGRLVALEPSRCAVPQPASAAPSGSTLDSPVWQLAQQELAAREVAMTAPRRCRRVGPATLRLLRLGS